MHIPHQIYLDPCFQFKYDLRLHKISNMVRSSRPALRQPSWLDTFTIPCRCLFLSYSFPMFSVFLFCPILLFLYVVCIVLQDLLNSLLLGTNSAPLNRYRWYTGHIFSRSVFKILTDFPKPHDEVLKGWFRAFWGVLYSVDVHIYPGAREKPLERLCGF
jgi:hypothetical protein